ncbi:MAG TPA: hypothetical protein VFN61_08040 [Acidimicrobiales bacterium]|nr:hypothetical protein [Acidimicrobiales bacterium]
MTDGGGQRGGLGDSPRVGRLASDLRAAQRQVGRLQVVGGPVRRALWAGWSLVCAAVLALPWAHNGEVARSGYGFVRALRGSGFSLPAGASTWDWLVFCVPALACTALALAYLGRHRAAAGAGTLAGLVTLAYGTCLLAASGTSGLVGPWAGTVAGLIGLALCTPPLLRRQRPAPTKTRRRSHARRQPLATTSTTT